MDTRTTSADFYPGGKTPVTAGGGITSGEAGGAAGEPMVPITKVEQLPEHYRESDMRSKINELARVISGGVAAIMAMVSLTLGAEPVKVLGVKKDALWNDDFVVTNVVTDFAGFATTNTVTGATNALAATFVRGLEVATNAVLQAGAKEIAAATNALSQSVDARLKASTNGSFSASSLEPYAKRTWVEAQGYLKSTNLTGYAQVNWVQNQGYIKKENASGEIARIVDEKIAAQDSTAAYRLMAADGSRWIDGTGVCWRVRSHVRVDSGAEMSSDGFVQEWQNEETSERVSFSDNDGIRRWEYCKVLTWSHDPDDPNSTWETVEYIYECETNLTAGTAILGLEIDNPLPDQNGVYPPERVILKYWLTTNAVTRLATTNDMPKIDFSKIPTLTTNDVCAIVTNELVKDEWELVGTINTDQIETDGDIRVTVSFFDERWWVFVDYPSDGVMGGTTLWVNETDEDATVLTIEPNRYVDGFFRRKKAGVNALGLARMKDLEKMPTHEVLTNTIQYVVTNEVASGWEVTTNGVPAPGATITYVLWDDVGVPMAGVEFRLEGKLVCELTTGEADIITNRNSWSDTIYFVEDEFEHLLGVRMVAEREFRNALGLAMAEDLEMLPTHETVTNVARSVVNSVWDASLGVAWEARMHNGHLYYIAVTNRPPEVK